MVILLKTSDTLAVILFALSRTENVPFLGRLHEVGTP